MAITPTSAAPVSPATPIVILAQHGTLQHVSVTNTASGRAVGGALAAGGTRWSSTAPLDYATSYTVLAEVVGPGAQPTQQQATVTTRGISVTSSFAAVEVRALKAVQSVLATRPSVLATARGLSHFGEHSLGWVALGATGALVDRRRRRDWLRAAVVPVLAHAVSIGVKQVVRRPRPWDESVAVHVRTPGRLSFPSSHASSSTAAAVLLARLTGSPVVAVIVPVMALSRLVLGVHYPTDVVAGSVLGGATAQLVLRKTERGSS